MEVKNPTDLSDIVGVDAMDVNPNLLNFNVTVDKGIVFDAAKLHGDLKIQVSFGVA